MEITKEDKAKLRYGSYYSLSGLVLLGIISVGKPLPVLLEIFYIIGFFVFIIGLALYQFFLYLESFEE